MQQVGQIDKTSTTHTINHSIWTITYRTAGYGGAKTQEMTNLKSLSLTVLEQLAFNAPKIYGVT